MPKVVLLLILFSLTCFSIKAQNHVKNQVIIMFEHNSTPIAEIEKNDFDTNFNIYISENFQPKLLSKDMSCWLYSVNSFLIDENRFLALTRNFKGVKAAQLNHLIYERINIPNDSMFLQQWNMLNTGQNGGKPGADIQATKAWDISTGGITSIGDTIVVAVVDGNFDLKNKQLDFWKNYWDNPNDTLDNDSNGYKNDYLGWNAVENTNTFPISSPSPNHGTHVSGIVAANGNDSVGITGVNWHTKIMAVRGSTQTESVAIAAYGYVLKQRKLYNQTDGEKGAFVVACNSSFGVDLGKPSDFPIWCSFYDSLGSVGIISSASTTNEAVDVDISGDIPTTCTSNFLISVTRTNNKDEKSYYAGYGIKSIDLGAPGTDISSTYPNNNYQSLSGTSMAAPHIAGAIALMVSAASPLFIQNLKKNPAKTALILKEQLLLNVDKLPSLSTHCTSGGRLNLFNAVSSIKNLDDSTLLIQEYERTIKETKINLITPNPANSMMEIEFQLEDKVASYFEIFNLAQKLVMRIEKGHISAGVHRQKIDVNALSSGVYMIRLSSTNKVSNSLKFCIVK